MLTKKKRLYADARENGKNISEAAIHAQCPAKTARQAGSRMEKDADVIRYRGKLAGNKPEAKQPFCVNASHSLNSTTFDADTSSVDAAILTLRAQLHSVDERIAQGAAKTLLDYELKRAGMGGKKQQKAEAAKQVANAGGRFGPRLPSPSSRPDSRRSTQ